MNESVSFSKIFMIRLRFEMLTDCGKNELITDWVYKKILKVQINMQVDYIKICKNKN